MTREPDILHNIWELLVPSPMEGPSTQIWRYWVPNTSYVPTVVFGCFCHHILVSGQLGSPKLGTAEYMCAPKVLQLRRQVRLQGAIKSSTCTAKACNMMAELGLVLGVLS